MNDELLFELMELLEKHEGEEEEVIVSEAVGILRDRSELLDQVLDNLARDLLGQAFERKPFVDAYREYEQQKLKPLQ